MRHVYTIHGVKEDGAKYSVVAYDSIQQCKKHFDKLNKLLEGNDDLIKEYDKTGNKATKYVVTKVLMFASFGGFEWLNKLGDWFSLRDNDQ